MYMTTMAIIVVAINGPTNDLMSRMENFLKQLDLDANITQMVGWKCLWPEKGTTPQRRNEHHQPGGGFQQVIRGLKIARCRERTSTD
jgi:hypothetical protein